MVRLGDAAAALRDRDEMRTASVVMVVMVGMVMIKAVIMAKAMLMMTSAAGLGLYIDCVCQR